MKPINSERLKTLGTGFKATFLRGVGMAPTDHMRVAMAVTSTTGGEEYGWLAEMPSVREWIGARQVHNLNTFSYAIKNKRWELTVGVSADAIEDDNCGIFTPRFEQMGRSTGALPCQLVFDVLKQGFTTACYDGQNFFDTAHPYKDATGADATQANTDGGGAGAPWFLIDTNQSVKPIILQTRKPFDWIVMDNPDDPHVFHNDEFLYGSKGRMNAGYGLWQFAYGSKNALNAASYGTARTAMLGYKSDGGRPIGVMPNLLLVPPQQESAARKLMNNELGANGETNEWKGTAEVVVCPWLA